MEIGLPVFEEAGSVGERTTTTAGDEVFPASLTAVAIFGDAVACLSHNGCVLSHSFAGEAFASTRAQFSSTAESTVKEA